MEEVKLDLENWRSNDAIMEQSEENQEKGGRNENPLRVMLLHAPSFPLVCDCLAGPRLCMLSMHALCSCLCV